MLCAVFVRARASIACSQLAPGWMMDGTGLPVGYELNVLGAGCRPVRAYGITSTSTSTSSGGTVVCFVFITVPVIRLPYDRVPVGYDTRLGGGTPLPEPMGEYQHTFVFVCWYACPLLRGSGIIVS
jgi:hypothetical protein